jgi:DNA modification methylase/predicted RNA-binding Zn-ribbon protein involved in translation (DUF1610 family)
MAITTWVTGLKKQLKKQEGRELLMPTNPELFHSTIIPAPDGSGKLFEERLDAPPQPITCLGKTFASDDERRAYFAAELRKHLADPEFRKIEGFPIGKDEDILALSDPPYYTACPNPWLQDFISEWESQKDKSQVDTPYHREPFAADVSEGKNDPIYNAHSYHTKVPHKAIMRYILHYTNPGDIVFDGFCGTGMTGVAAQMCGNRAEVESLGYKVEDDGTILQEETDENEKKHWKAFSKLGARKAVLNDLSPAATFIAYNYNTPVDVVAFEKEAKRILEEVEAECGWMYETMYTDGKTKGKINYTVWSDVFICPECSKEVIFWEAAVEKKASKVKDEFLCPHCGAKLTKRRMERAWTTKFDTAINESIKQAKQIPVLINYTVNGKRAEKIPDSDDFALIEKIESIDIPYDYPRNEIPDGFNTRQPKISHGITYMHHFYSKRNLYVLACLNNKFEHGIYRLLFQSVNSTLTSKIVRYNLGHRGNGPVSGTLYVPSLIAETEILRLVRGKLYDFIKALHETNYSQISCGSSSRVFLPSQSINYVFIDPPFGSNINYSELNFLWESWLKVITNNGEEAIVNGIQQKSSVEYRELITICFKEMYRILKPGHWMTVEFSNTQTSIWNIIQTSLSSVGFIIANVSALDKKQGSFKAVTTPTAVRQDLVISAYKPNGGFEERFIKEADTEEGVWDFIRTHLRYLPVVKIQNKELIPVDERQPRTLFNQVVAYYIRKGIDIPIASSQVFQAGLKEKFDERDGMYFLYEQALEYDKKKLQSGGLSQSELFVINEESAIQWLKALLSEKTRAIQDIYPEYMQKLTGFDKKEEKLELRTLLEQNFIEDEAGKWHVPDPENAFHVEKIREKALLKEFEYYKSASRRFKVFRIEAVRAGFKKAYNDHDYETILKVADKLSSDVIEEDPMLLMWYTSARTRMGED